MIESPAAILLREPPRLADSAHGPSQAPVGEGAVEAHILKLRGHQ